MSVSENRQRNKLVGLRLLPEEHRALAAQAARLGVTVPALILDTLRSTDTLPATPELIAR